MKFVSLALVVLASFEASHQQIQVTPVPGGRSGTNGFLTRYWDCCKPACGWTSLANHNPPVNSCAEDGVTRLEANAANSCTDSGPAFACTNQASFAVNDSFALGFSGVSFAGGVEYDFCCHCILLTFDSSTGKRMIVQATNVGADYGSNQFDIEIPGGGVGGYNACTRQWGAPSQGWGDQYGGIHAEADCNQLPTQLQQACRFRFQWMEDIIQHHNNHEVQFQEVQCPRELISISGCDPST